MITHITIECDNLDEITNHLDSIKAVIKNKKNRKLYDKVLDDYYETNSPGVFISIHDDNCYGTHDAFIIEEAITELRLKK